MQLTCICPRPTANGKSQLMLVIMPSEGYWSDRVLMGDGTLSRFFPRNCRAAVVNKTMIMLRKTARSLTKHLFLGGGKWGGLCVKRRHMLWYVLS